MSPWLPELLLRSQSDERLVTLARAGHDRAFATIVERYRPELLALARRLTSDVGAEDVVQQALLSAFVALRSGTEVNHVRGWLYQIVRNAATKVRASAELPLDAVVLAGESLEDVVQRRAAALGAVTELARLPERQRDALVAVALDGRLGAEVAMTMGLSDGALRQLVHRARAALRGAVTAVTPWPLARWLAALGPAPGPEVTAAAGVVSAAGTAKVGTLLLTGLLASAVSVLPTVDQASLPGSHSHAHVRSHRGAQALVPVGDGATTATGSSVIVTGPRPRSGRSAGGAAPSSGRRAHRGGEDGRHTGVADVGAGGLPAESRSDSRGSAGGDGADRSDGTSRTSLASGRGGDAAAPGAGSVTSSDDSRSASSGDSLESAAVTSQSGGSGSDSAVSRDSGSSTATTAVSSAGSGSDSGGGRDGRDGWASGGNRGGDGGSTSGDRGSDTHSSANP